MKFFRIVFISVLVFLTIHSCKKENQNIWKIDSDLPTENIKITDISKSYFDPRISVEQFKQEFPWFQGSVTDQDFVARRKDTLEAKIYKDAAAKVNLNQMSKDLGMLFPRIKYYFPGYQTPKVFTFSSGMQMVQNPIIYDPKQGYLFIDISAFMGDGNPHYKGLEAYFQKSMNPNNIVPKISQSIASTLVPFDNNHQKFLDQLVYNGKIMTLQDAFLPNTPDYLKMNYTQKQYDWDVANEANIWDYFVESNLLFSSDAKLVERFIDLGPFSKFYTAIDQESSPQVGIFIGWQICKKFFQEKPKTALKDFLLKDGQEIFNESNYKPKK